MNGTPDRFSDDWPVTVGFADGSPSAVAPPEEIPVHPSGFAVRQPAVAITRSRTVPGRRRDATQFVPAVGPVLVAGVGSLLLLPAEFTFWSPIVVLLAAVVAGVSALRRGARAGWLAAAVLVVMVGLGQTWAGAPVLAAVALGVWAVTGGVSRG